VLSARTSEISSETNRITEQAAAQLDTLAAGLADSVTVFANLRTEGLTQQSLLDQRGCAEEKELHAFRDNALETLRVIGGTLDQIREHANRALASVKFDHFHQVTIPALRTPLEAIADTAEQWLKSCRGAVAPGSQIEGLQREYTMASEREVFAEVMSGNHTATPGPAGILPAAHPEIELFVDSPVEPLWPGQPEKTAAPVPADTAVSGDAGLGANVDLF